jgi:hypothetical protein
MVRLLSSPQSDGAGEHAVRRRRTSHGPNWGAGVWLKSCSSATQVKFAAMLVLPLPEYFATLGKTQSGRVIWTAGGVSPTNLVATIVSGATPVSTQVTSGVSACAGGDAAQDRRTEWPPPALLAAGVGSHAFRV